MFASNFWVAAQIKNRFVFPLQKFLTISLFASDFWGAHSNTEAKSEVVVLRTSTNLHTILVELEVCFLVLKRKQRS
jgi:hypothetical protein